MELRLYDIVKLAQDSQGLPGGSRGTVVDEFDGGVMVEFLDTDGTTREVLDIPLAQLLLVERPAVHA
jgi:hypothetical protein